jgi:glycosyltransferase involved in cell wall biosynthesis
MRILWVKAGGLWPLDTGGRLRTFHIVSELARRHSVTLVTTHRPDDRPEVLRARLQHCEAVVSFAHSAPKQGSAAFTRAVAASWLSPLPVDLFKWRVPALRAAVAEALATGQADLCVADFLYTTPNVPFDASVPVLFFDHNVEHVIWRRLAAVESRPWRRAALALEWRKVRRAEATACRRARLTVAVSDVDRRVLATHAPSATIRSISTGVDTEFFAPTGTPETPGALVFTGSMDWYPNEDAMLDFMATMLPAIRTEIPGTSLTIVGRHPSSRLRAAAAAAGARVTGTVDDVRPWVADASVFVVPLRVGGGTRLKIFEALAMGKAVVSTSIGAEGLPVQPGTHFVASDTREAFVRAVVDLLREPVRRKTLGAEGRRLVEERFGWSQIGRAFGDLCAEAAA